MKDLADGNPRRTLSEVDADLKRDATTASAAWYCWVKQPTAENKRAWMAAAAVEELCRAEKVALLTEVSSPPRPMRSPRGEHGPERGCSGRRDP